MALNEPTTMRNIRGNKNKIRSLHVNDIWDLVELLRDRKRRQQVFKLHVGAHAWLGRKAYGLMVV